MLSKRACSDVAAVVAEAAEVGRLQRDEHQRRDAQQDEQADQHLHVFLGHRMSPFRGHGVENINAVKMKSMPSTDSDETTTVRVVA